MYSPQRIRDPLHNLIEFKGSHFDSVMWKVLDTPQFQRLRRIKQLGFSEMVFPGATHSRFAHSVGTFHTARRLMSIIEKHLGTQSYVETSANLAIAAALVHDVGHGPFSHAFEDVGKRLGLPLARHELVSEKFIRDSEISAVFSELGSGFANDVANVIGRDTPKDVYDSVVSSQFDADRLDYMRRDRLMTGSHHSEIDFEWLMSNLKIGKVAMGVDDTSAGELETFVLGSKAVYAAEAYVLGLFQLYPTVYLHKTVRGAEKIFSELLIRIHYLIHDNAVRNTGLPANHPLIRFLRKANQISLVTDLDDSVIWGALGLMKNAKDGCVSELAGRLKDRRFYKSIDVRQNISTAIGAKVNAHNTLEIEEEEKAVEQIAIQVKNRISKFNDAIGSDVPRIIWDATERKPYKKIQESKGPLNQIRIEVPGGGLEDLDEMSRVVRAIRPCKVARAYFREDDQEAKNQIKDIISEEAKK